MLVMQAFEDPLGRVPLLSSSPHVRLQDRINHRNEWIELGLRWRLAPSISRWRRLTAHLRNPVPAHAENQTGFAPTVTRQAEQIDKPPRRSPRQTFQSPLLGSLFQHFSNIVSGTGDRMFNA
jgi:hypothetical protein